MLIVKDTNIQAVMSIFRKYNSISNYSIVEYNGQRYAVFDRGIAAAMLEADMKFGCDYKEGRIIERD